MKYRRRPRYPQRRRAVTHDPNWTTPRCNIALRLARFYIGAARFSGPQRRPACRVPGRSSFKPPPRSRRITGPIGWITRRRPPESRCPRILSQMIQTLENREVSDPSRPRRTGAQCWPTSIERCRPGGWRKGWRLEAPHLAELQAEGDRSRSSLRSFPRGRCG